MTLRTATARCWINRVQTAQMETMLLDREYNVYISAFNRN